MDDKRYIFENIFWEETIGVVSETMDQISTRFAVVLFYGESNKQDQGK